MRWLLRMAAQNALRRRSQSLVVVAGLMMGTAIIAGSLASGDSLTFGISQGAHDALGPADLFLQVEGQLHFPRSLYEDLAADASVANVATALSPLLYEEAAFTNPATKQGEPRVSLIGLDPAANRAFGAFTTVDGRSVDATELGPREVYVSERIAENLGARAGDTVGMHFAQAFTPVIPRVQAFQGNLTGAGACVAEPLCPFVSPPTDTATFSFPVEEGAVSITSIVAWFGPAAEATDLDQTLRAPDGAAFRNVNGTPVAPDNPSVLNVSEAPEVGAWTLEVGAKVAANQPFRALVLVFYEEYDLAAIQAFAREAEAFGFEVPDLADLAVSRSENVTIAAVVTKDGFGDFLLGENAFMRQEAVAELYGAEGKVNLIIVATDDEARALDVIPRAVNASAAARPDEAGIGAVKVVPVKARWLEAANEAGSLFKEFLTTIGSFTVIAGIMLIVNIFVMLAEERKSELGMARAVGLRRRHLVALFGLEGMLYGLAASVLGVFLGLAIAYVLIWGMNDVFSQSTAENAVLHIPFHVEPSSLLWAFAAGFVITLVTVAIASWRVSRMNVVRAIRRIEEPPRRASPRTFFIGAALLVLGAGASVYGFLSGHFVSKVLAPEIALFGLGMAASRFIPRRFAFPIAGAGVALYAGWSIFRLGNPEGLVNRVMGPVRGVLIVLAVVLILLYLPQIVRWTSAMLLRVRTLVPAVRPGVAYPLEKKTRTGLTVTMFALVVLVVVAFSVFGATFSLDLTEQSGGYEVEGDATVPIGDLATWLAANPQEGSDPLAGVARYDELRYSIAFGGDLLRIDGDEVHYQGPPVDYIYAFDEPFARNNRFEFESLDPAYASAEEAYLAVLADPSLAIVSSIYNFDETGQPGVHEVGDSLTMQTPDGVATMRIIGFQRQLYLGGVFVHPSVLEENFQRIRGEYLFDLREGVDAREAARGIEAAFQPAGMNAESIRDVAERQAEQTRRFLTLFQLFLGFGLVVGIASLGIVTARSVLERRQEIGMLRAVGYSRRNILHMLYIEIFLTTTLGVIVGGIIGLIVSYGVVTSTPGLDTLGVTFSVPWLDLFQILGLIYVAVFLATVIPARRGSRIPPAEAVRYVE